MKAFPFHIGPLILMLVLIPTFLFLPIQGKTQDSYGIKYFGLSIHPLGEHENAHLMPLKLDPNAYLVLNMGAGFSYERYIFRQLVSIKISQGLYSDCAARLGGFTHTGLRGKILQKGKHYLGGGLGPTWVYRRNWQELDDYVNPQFFKGDENDRWQRMFIWYGGEFEYRYSLNDQLDFALSFVPGFPDLMNLSLGLTFFPGNKKQH